MEVQLGVTQGCLRCVLLHGSQAAQIKFQTTHKTLAFSLLHVISSEKLFLACVHLQSSKSRSTKHVIHFVVTGERKKEKAGKWTVIQTEAGRSSCYYFCYWYCYICQVTPILCDRSRVRALQNEKGILDCILTTAYWCTSVWVCLFYLLVLFLSCQHLYTYSLGASFDESIDSLLLLCFWKAKYIAWSNVIFIATC